MTELEEKVKRLERLTAIDEFEKEANRVNIEFSRKPVWKQAVEEGDRLNDGSDEQEYGED